MQPYHYWVRKTAHAMRKEGLRFNGAALIQRASQSWSTKNLVEKAAIAKEAAAVRVPNKPAAERVLSREARDLYRFRHGGVALGHAEAKALSPKKYKLLSNRSKALMREARVRAGLASRRTMAPIRAFLGARVRAMVKDEKIPVALAVPRVHAEFKALSPAARKGYEGRPAKVRKFGKKDEVLLAQLVATLKGEAAPDTTRSASTTPSGPASSQLLTAPVGKKPSGPARKKPAAPASKKGSASARKKPAAPADKKPSAGK